MQNKIYLITYPDSMGKNLKELDYVLNKYFNRLVYGVHVLPFYPSSGDRGFAPLTHLKVDEKFGSWSEIRKIGGEFELMADLVLNHISSKSDYFLHYLRQGEKSKYKDIFLKVDDVFREGIIDERALKMIYRPRTTQPFTDYDFADGNTKRFWTTFTATQIDVNWEKRATKQLFEEFLIKLAKSKVKVIRLDAVGYVLKKLWTNSFFINEVFEILEWIKKVVEPYDVKLLCEVHTNYFLQKKIARKVDFVYDFALPVLVLHTLYFGSSKRLKEWIKVRPNNCFTTLDTHDGIGVVDVEGLLSFKETKRVVDKIYEMGGRASFRASGKNSDNLDIYQINSTYYSALGNEDLYIIARAIQFFVPGIPQVYYVGALVGENDVKNFEKTNHGRDINRHNYTIREIEKEISRSVVRRLFQLMKFRNEYPAFDGKFKLLENEDSVLIMEWKKEIFECILFVNLKVYEAKIYFKEVVGDKIVWKELDLNDSKVISVCEVEGEKVAQKIRVAKTGRGSR